jgi:hypothetical protein
MINPVKNAPGSPIGLSRSVARIPTFDDFASVCDPLVAKISANGGH